MILRCWFLVFLVKNRVNNLAMVGSITWPYFGPKFCTEIWPGYWPYFFHTFLLKLFFSKISFSLQKEEDFWKTKKTTKNNKKQMTRLLTYAGQVIDPTAYMCVLFQDPLFGLYQLIKGPLEKKNLPTAERSVWWSVLRAPLGLIWGARQKLRSVYFLWFQSNKLSKTKDWSFFCPLFVGLFKISKIHFRQLGGPYINSWCFPLKPG